MGSVIKKRRKRMAKKKHRKLLKKTQAPQAAEEDAHPAQEQEVAHVPPAAGRAAWSRGRAWRVPAFPRARGLGWLGQLIVSGQGRC
jgi:hypothetical protein